MAPASAWPRLGVLATRESCAAARAARAAPGVQAGGTRPRRGGGRSLGLARLGARAAAARGGWGLARGAGSRGCGSRGWGSRGWSSRGWVSRGWGASRSATLGSGTAGRAAPGRSCRGPSAVAESVAQAVPHRAVAVPGARHRLLPIRWGRSRTRYSAAAPGASRSPRPAPARPAGAARCPAATSGRRCRRPEARACGADRRSTRRCAGGRR